MIVELFTNHTERVAPDAVVFSGSRSLTVVRSAPHGKRWLVAFLDIGSREEADALHGAVLTAPPLDHPDELWVHEMIGCAVTDTFGHALGVVVAVEANPASDLLVLDDDGLIPMRFVVEHRPGELVVDPPAGLLE